MALNGTAWAGYASAFRTYLAGQTPDELVSTEPGGTDLPFVHDSEREGASVSEAGLVRDGALVVFVEARTRVGATYTYRGFTWQVAAVDYDRCAGADWPHRVELVRHVS